MLVNEFFAAFLATAQVCATVAGATLAVLVFCLLSFLFGLFACAVFDRATAWLAARWRRKKRRPTGRIAQIILNHSADSSV